MAKRPLRLLLIALLALSAALVIRTALQPEKPAATPSAAAERMPLGKLENVDYTRTLDGAVQWQMKAEQAAYYQDTSELTLSQVDGGVVTPERRITLRANQGRVFFTTRTGLLEGGVVGRSDDGYVVYTSKLEFDAVKRVLFTDEAVSLEGKNLSLQGVGMDLDLANQTFVLRQGVKATMWSGEGS